MIAREQQMFPTIVEDYAGSLCDGMSLRTCGTASCRSPHDPLRRTQSSGWRQ
jgi:hypothetical protein